MTAPAAIPSAEEIAKLISGAPFPSPKSLAKARAILALFAPILAEKEREIANLDSLTDIMMETHLKEVSTWRNAADQFRGRALAAEAALAAAVEALAPFADEKNGVMQDLLWGDQPDSATMTITCPLGQIRKAREAVRAAAIRAQGE